VGDPYNKNVGCIEITPDEILLFNGSVIIPITYGLTLAEEYNYTDDYKHFSENVEYLLNVILSHLKDYVSQSAKITGFR